MEHRLARRQPVHLPATMRTAKGQEIAVTIVNVSLGGAFLAVPDPHTAVRGLINVEFTLAGPDNRLCRWPAFVIHGQADGIGVIFDESKYRELELVLAATNAETKEGRR
ncbi:MAG: PilZ domain-containing protein [Gammaproteobacteria bacterium]